MTGAQTLPSFINKGQPKAHWPAWLLAHTVGRPDPNGSFMIRTKVGNEDLQARVHPGAMVFERNGIAYTRPDAGAARLFIAELEEAEKPDPKKAAREDAPAPQSAKPFKMRTVSPPPPKIPTRQYAAQKGRPPSIENRAPSELGIDDSYQRSIDTGPSRALIVSIANNWDWRMCLPLVVSKRDNGELFVIDGQHRLAAAKMRGDIPFLPCCVHVFDSVADEAKMFVAMNRARRAINRLDDFHAAEASGDADVLAIKAMIEAVGFTVSRKTGSAAWAPGEVAFTTAIAKCRRRYGDKVAQGSLAIMAEAFPDQRLAVGSPVFTAICAVLGDEELKPERDRLVAAVGTFDMAGWASLIAECKGGEDRNRHLREFLRSAYADAKVAA